MARSFRTVGSMSQLIPDLIQSRPVESIGFNWGSLLCCPPQAQHTSICQLFISHPFRCQRNNNKNKFLANCCIGVVCGPAANAKPLDAVRTLCTRSNFILGPMKAIVQLQVYSAYKPTRPHWPTGRRSKPTGTNEYEHGLSLIGIFQKLWSSLDFNKISDLRNETNVPFALLSAPRCHSLPVLQLFANAFWTLLLYLVLQSNDKHRRKTEFDFLPGNNRLFHGFGSNEKKNRKQKPNIPNVYYFCLPLKRASENNRTFIILLGLALSHTHTHTLQWFACCVCMAYGTACARAFKCHWDVIWFFICHNIVLRLKTVDAQRFSAALVWFHIMISFQMAFVALFLFFFFLPTTLVCRLPFVFGWEVKISHTKASTCTRSTPNCDSLILRSMAFATLDSKYRAPPWHSTSWALAAKWLPA